MSNKTKHSVVGMTVLVSFCLYSRYVNAQRLEWTERTLRSGIHYVHEFYRSREARRIDVHRVDVDLCDPHVVLRATAPSEGNVPVDRWAHVVGALVAINGDYFDVRTRLPLGPARGSGQWWAVARREHRDALLTIGRDGDVQVLDTPDWNSENLWLNAQSQIADQWSEVIAVRERVVLHGQPRLSPVIEHDGHRHPRTAVGLSNHGRRLTLLAIDGRSRFSAGVNTEELAELMVSLGISEGLKLDGGGSTTMYIQEHGIVNRPSDGNPRRVGNHLAVIWSDRPREHLPAMCTSGARTTPIAGVTVVTHNHLPNPPITHDRFVHRVGNRRRTMFNRSAIVAIGLVIMFLALGYSLVRARTFARRTIS